MNQATTTRRSASVLRGRARTVCITGAVRYSPDVLGRGLFLTLAPSYGAGPNDNSPWDRVLASSDPATPRLRLSAQAGYAFSAAGAPGLVTVVAGVRPSLDDATPGVARAGLRYRSRGSLALAVGLDRTIESGGTAPTSAASIQVRWSF
jgi:hypothetical protein